MKHVPGTGSLARPVSQRSSALSLHHGCLLRYDKWVWRLGNESKCLNCLKSQLASLNLESDSISKTTLLHMYLVLCINQRNSCNLTSGIHSLPYVMVTLPRSMVMHAESHFLHRTMICPCKRTHDAWSGGSDGIHHNTMFPVKATVNREQNIKVISEDYKLWRTYSDIQHLWRPNVK